MTSAISIISVYDCSLSKRDWRDWVLSDL